LQAALRDNSRSAFPEGRTAPERELAAWYGVGGIVPGDWNIVAASGDRREGYLRVDGPHEETAEFRWKRVRRKPELVAVAEQYLKQVEKHGRRKRIDFETDLEGLRSGGKEKPEDLRFRWQAERQGFGRLTWCRECRRTVIAQVSAPAGSPIQQVADRVLDSIRDHGREPNMLDWGVYGLAFSTPSNMKLIRYRMMSGFLSMNFKGRAARVIVERWGLADTLLADGGLITWHEKDYLAELKMFAGQTTAMEWSDHEALVTEGHESGMRRLKSLVRAFGMPSRAERFASLVWHCEPTNRIVGVRAFAAMASDLARAVASTVRCHQR